MLESGEANEDPDHIVNYHLEFVRLLGSLSLGNPVMQVWMNFRLRPFSVTSQYYFARC